MDITKAIIPAAGLGTRFLPYTKAIPKEMLPLLEKPAIQQIIEEGIASEIKQFLVITGRSKDAIADHLGKSPELESFLRERGKLDLIASTERIARYADFAYIRQEEPLGLGHAIALARPYIGKEYFGVFLPDDILIGRDPGLAQLIRVARQEKASVIAVQEVPLECAPAYGMVGIKKQITPNLFQVSHLVEKPDRKDAPSNLAIIGRYVLSHKIFQALDETAVHATGELQLTDGITQMMKLNEKVFAYKVQGARYDIGNPMGWLKATIALAFHHPEYGPHVRKFINEFNTLESSIYNQDKNLVHGVD